MDEKKQKRKDKVEGKMNSTFSPQRRKADSSHVSWSHSKRQGPHYSLVLFLKLRCRQLKHPGLGPQLPPPWLFNLGHIALLSVTI